MAKNEKDKEVQNEEQYLEQVFIEQANDNDDKMNHIERLQKELESSFGNYSKALYNSNTDFQSKLSQAIRDQQNELNQACGKDDANEQFQEINESYSNLQLDLRKALEEEVKEAKDQYLCDVQDLWVKVPSNKIDAAEIGEIGRIFWVYATRGIESSQF